MSSPYGEGGNKSINDQRRTPLPCAPSPDVIASGRLDQRGASDSIPTNAVVTKYVPDYGLAGGVPARLLSRHNSELHLPTGTRDIDVPLR